jgi:hypothetical protein
VSSELGLSGLALSIVDVSYVPLVKSMCWAPFLLLLPQLLSAGGWVGVLDPAWPGCTTSAWGETKRMARYYVHRQTAHARCRMRWVHVWVGSLPACLPCRCMEGWWVWWCGVYSRSVGRSVPFYGGDGGWVRVSDRMEVGGFGGSGVGRVARER